MKQFNQTIMHKQKYILTTLSLHSFYASNVSKILQKKLNTFLPGIHIDSIIVLPKKIKKFSLLRSPHVNKKAQEQYKSEFIKTKLIFSLYFFVKKRSTFWLNKFLLSYLQTSKLAFNVKHIMYKSCT